MIDVGVVNDFLNYGLGIGAEVIGQYYDVYRLQYISSGTILNSQSKIASSVNMRFSVLTAGWAFEQTKIQDMIYEGWGDTSTYDVFDVFKEIGPDGDGSYFTLVQKRPLNPHVFMRTEINATLSRPTGNGPTPEPTLGRGQKQQAGKSHEWTLVLENGLYTYRYGATPATIPVGLQPYKRLGPDPPIKEPTTTHTTEMFAYVPFLPGVELMPGDIISDANANRFLCQNISTLTSGAQGYWVITTGLFN